MLNILNDLARIGAVAHNHDASYRFAFAIPLGDAAAHVGAELHIGHLAQQDGDAVRADTDGDLLQVVQALDVAADAQDELLFAHLDRSAAHLAVAALHGHAHLGEDRL